MNLLFVLLCLSTIAVRNVRGKSKVRYFPDYFEFGASTASYQVEGAWDEDGKSLSIWDVAAHMSPIKDGSTGDVAADSYHLYKRDVEIMKELGLNFYRFSVSWSRILPSGFANQINQAGIDYYNNLINEMLANNIKPFLTIYHWDLPQSLQDLGGWANPMIVDWFVDYAKVLFENFGDRVKFWISINEPKQICTEGYGTDKKAPMVNMSGIADYMCNKNVLLAHAKTYRLYDEIYRKDQNGSIGISISCTWYEPASDSNDDQQAAEDARIFDWGQYVHAIFTKEGDFPEQIKKNVAYKSAEQGYAKSRLPELSVAEVDLIRGSSDFFGLNSYTSKLVYRDASVEGMYGVPSYLDDLGVVMVPDPSWPQSQSSWLQEVPWGFYKLFKEIRNVYGNPTLYVTENGWSTDAGLIDDDRVRYYRNYLNALLDTIEEGSDIRGYTAWSMIDNFEWMQGYADKFGLYEVDFTSPERTRTPRKSAYIYKEIVRTKSLDPDYEPEILLDGTDRKSVV